MKVILNQDVKGLGTKGAVVEVAEGHARNYLLPRGLAVEASAGRLREAAQRQETAKSKKDKARAEAVKLAEQLEGREVTIAMRCGEGGKLFGSVTTREVAEVLAKNHKIKVDRKQIELKDSIKALGSYPVAARLYPEIVARFTLVVTAE